MSFAQAVERCVRAGFADGGPVVSVVRQANPYASISPSEIVRVALAGGSTVPLFLKPMGPFEPGHPDKADWRREGDVYRRLFTDPALPVPASHGCLPAQGGSPEALLLEYVDAPSLRYQAFPAWRVAARALCRLHLHFASRADELRALPSLLRLDDAYFESWAARAIGVARARSDALGQRLGHAMRGHAAVLQRLRQQPPTLVHNDLAPKNVLVGGDGRGPVRIVDWEMAGIGPGLLDLAHLLAGLGEDDERGLVEAYLDEAARAQPGRIVRGDPGSAIAACKVAKGLHRLARSDRWNLSDDAIRQRIDEIERETARAGQRR